MADPIRTLGLLVILCSPCASAGTLAWWRFEDQEPNTKLAAMLGTTEPPYTTTISEHGTENQLRTFNSRPHLYPPDTSGTFLASDPPPLAGDVANRRAVRFVGNQDFYTTSDTDRPPIDSANLREFTIEGLFRLDVLSHGNGGKYQTIIGKDGRPVGRLPFQPFVAVVAGQDDEFMSRDCLSVNLIDRSGQYRTAASRTPLQAGRWYAFAAVCDGQTLRLLLNRFDGKGYQVEAQTQADGGLIDSTGTWTVGRGMFDGAPNSWLQGEADEIRVSDSALREADCLAAGVNELQPVARTFPAIAQKPPRCVEGLADPSVLLHDGVYYLYGTGDTHGFDVWTSTDLKQWEKAARVLEAGDGVWGDSAFWAPGVLAYRGRFYLFYSSSGILPDTGGRRSTRIGIAVADSPGGPFREVVPRLPLLGRAVIDPELFVDSKGVPWLFFVADVNENNGRGEIYVVRLGDDLLCTVGEPTLCFSASQPWEGTAWNEGPAVLKFDDTYVMMYSGEFWGSHDYAVGFATAPAPTGPWDKHDFNPILRRYAGLLGTGHNSVVPTPDGKGWLTFFHAHRNDRDTTRDTYFARLDVTRDERGRINLSVHP